MPLLTKVGSFQISTGIAGTTQPITGVGFTPKFVKFFWNGRTDASNAVGNGTHQYGTGVAVNAAVSYPNYSATTKSQNAVSPSNTSSDVHQTECIFTILAGSNAGDGAAHVLSWGSDGFTLEIADQFSAAITVHYMVFGGSDIYSMETLITTEPAAIGTVNMVFSAAPDYLYCIANPSGPVTGGIADDSRMCIGGATFRGGAIQQSACSFGANDNVGTSGTASYTRSDKFIAHIDSAFAGGLTGQSNISAISGGTVTLNWTTVSGPATREHIVLAIKGGNWRVGVFDTVAAGNNITVSSMGFRPKGVMFFSTTHTQDTDGVTSSPDERVQGAVDSAGNQRSLTIEDSDGLATTRISTAIQFDSIYAATNGASGPAIDSRITWTSYENNGFTLAQPTSDGTGRDVCYVACGDQAVGARFAAPGGKENFGVTKYGVNAGRVF